MFRFFSGSIRKNIDPFGTADDPTLNSILRSIRLLKTVKERPELDAAAIGALTLDPDVSVGGENLSRGMTLLPRSST